MKIALIDSLIDETKIHAKKYTYFNLCSVEDLPSDQIGQNKETHGTMCAMMLDACTDDYELVGIQTMPSYGEMFPKTFGSVNDLKNALELCATLNVDIVSMSSVSSALSDTEVLYDMTQRLAQRSLILAALDNRRYMTVPTGFPFVLGVQADWTGRRRPGKISYRKNDPLFAKIYANCDLKLLKEIYVGPSNSLAVPVAAAYMNNLMNSTKLQPSQIRERLEELLPQYYPEAESEKLLYGKSSRVGYDIAQIPTVRVVSLCDRSDEICAEIVDCFYHNYRAQVTCLTCSETERDIRFRSIKHEGSLDAAIAFMRYHYKTDLILVAENLEHVDKPKYHLYDVEVICTDNTALVRYEEHSNRIELGDLPETLYRLLDGEPV